MVFAVLFGNFQPSEPPEGSTDNSVSTPQKLPQEKMFPSSEAPCGLPVTDEETEYDSRDDNELALESPKKVRFAMDDKVANRKRRNRNLRKHILEKSRSTSDHNSDSNRKDGSNNDLATENTNIDHRNNNEIPIRTTIPVTPSPNKTNSQVARRRKNIKMAASLFAGFG